MKHHFVLAFVVFVVHSLVGRAQFVEQFAKKPVSDGLQTQVQKPQPTSFLYSNPSNHNRGRLVEEVTVGVEEQDLWYVLKTDLPNNYWSGVKMDEFILQLDLGAELSADLVRVFEDKGLLLASSSMRPELQNFFVFEGETQTKAEVIDLAQKLRMIPHVQFVEPVVLVSPSACPTNDPYVYNDDDGSGLQWGMYTTWVDSVWCLYQGGASTWTAIIDSGTDWFHEDLYNTAWDGYDFADIDDDPSPATPDNTHGTHVAGIVGAEVNNGIGVAGVSSDSLYIAKVQSDYTSDDLFELDAIVNALNVIATNPLVKVVNMSFGSSSFSASELVAINNCWDAGKVLVASAGNDATINANYPADYSNVMKVSSLGLDANYDYAFASYSNYGNIDICAPGGSDVGQGPDDGFGYIWSTLPGGYGYQYGTSMAAPLVAGIAHTLFAANPFLTNQEARDLIVDNPLPFDFGPSLYFGSGVVCAWCAYESACLDYFDNPAVVDDLTICPGESTVASAAYHPDITYQWYKAGDAEAELIPGATQNTLNIVAPGSYLLESTSVGGCITYSDWVNVFTPPSPFAQFSYTVSGNYVSFTNMSNNASSYSWSFGDGFSSTLVNPEHAYMDAGTYQATLTVTNACGVASTSTTTIVISPPSGIHDNEMLSQISFGPNPVSGQLVINVPNSEVQVSIMDASGRVVAAYSNSNKIVHKGLTQGQYLLRFTTKNGMQRVEKICVL